MKTIPIVSADRQCGSCTACCEGWASGVAYGHKFYPGRPCHYMGVGEHAGCTIYEQRPKEPCERFKCEWLTNKDIPAWMVPNKVKALLVAESIQGINYLTVKEMGERLDSTVLSWIIQSRETGLLSNIRYEIDGGWNFIGTSKFIELMLGLRPGTRLSIDKQL